MSGLVRAHAPALFDNQIRKGNGPRQFGTVLKKRMRKQKQDVTAKLAACEASLKRWQTRLKRATTKVNELDRQRRRLQAQFGPVSMFDLIGKPFSAKDVGADQQPVKPVIKELVHHDDLAVMPSNVAKAKQPVSDVTDISMAELNMDIPPFLKRTQADVDKMKAKRAAKEAAEKSRMPLTGKAALEAIRQPAKRKVKA